MNEPTIDIPWIQPREASIKLMRDAVRYEVRNAFVVAAPLGVGAAVHNFVIFLCSPSTSSVRPSSLISQVLAFPPSLSRASAAFPLPSLPPSLHWLVSRDTFIRARLCGERGQIAQADHRPCQIPRERGRHNRQHFVGRDRFCNGVLLHPTNLAATVICKAQKTRASETGQTYEEL